ncbi:hypothetical protein MPNT_400010 [Candidatus Methylacidithermus pantelleriae]|uniref:Uncharacterized protein n=1 Tax=Candidatus Methylacidithermus pantelleriae TaxID=2744239 RepID=A0A8J2BPM3_9BACT|nr:hypothetical protein MPNT_400010 [Candidatus Methylacidithermus pantelleriae]
MNGHRRGLIGQVCDPQVGVILVEYRDRLTRLGFEYGEAALAAQSRSILVANLDDMATISCATSMRPLFGCVPGFPGRDQGRTVPRRRSKRSHEQAVCFYLPDAVARDARAGRVAFNTCAALYGWLGRAFSG